MRESAWDRISVGGDLYLEHSICQKEHKSQDTHRLDQVLDPVQAQRIRQRLRIGQHMPLNVPQIRETVHSQVKKISDRCWRH